MWKGFGQRKFRKRVRQEREKRFLFRTETPTFRWVEFYLKARRGAYFRPIYSAFAEGKRTYHTAFVSIGALLIVLALYILFGSPYFRISPNRVIIERTDEFSDINIAYKAIEGIYGTSLWFIDTNEIASAVRSLEHNIEKVSTKRLYPNGLKILIQSFPPEFLVYFSTLDRHFLLSRNGVLIPDQTKRQDLPFMRIYSEDFIEWLFLDYKEVIAPERMERIRGILHVFKKEFPSLAIPVISYYETENETHITFENGTRVLFVLDSSLEKQLQGLKIASDNTPGLLSGGEHVYIDARIVGKIFTCKDKNVCMRNLEKIYGNTLK